MTADEMLAEARSIARPCLYLTDEPGGGPVAAVWKGVGLVPYNEPRARHWITIDCTQVSEAFEDLGLTGIISIYAHGDCRTGRCVFDRERESLAGADGTRLFAHPGMSLPTVEQLLRHPTPRIQEWMTQVGCAVSGKSWTGTEESSAVCRGYSERFTAEDPVRHGGDAIFAVLGGWPIEVYEDDWAQKVKNPRARQFVFTYADSEPLIQVWVDDGGKFHVRQIIS